MLGEKPKPIGHDQQQTTDRLRSGTGLPVQIENRIEGPVYGVEAWATYRPVGPWSLSAGTTLLSGATLMRIISSPRILTLDNREARISQGTLIPFSQISAQGVQTTFQAEIMGRAVSLQLITIGEESWTTNVLTG